MIGILNILQETLAWRIRGRIWYLKQLHHVTASYVYNPAHKVSLHLSLNTTSLLPRLEKLSGSSSGTEDGVAITAKAKKRTARALAFLVPLLSLMKSSDKLSMPKGPTDWAAHRGLQVRIGMQL